MFFLSYSRPRTRRRPRPRYAPFFPAVLLVECRCSKIRLRIGRVPFSLNYSVDQNHSILPASPRVFEDEDSLPDVALAKLIAASVSIAKTGRRVRGRF